VPSGSTSTSDVVSSPNRKPWQVAGAPSSHQAAPLAPAPAPAAVTPPAPVPPARKPALAPAPPAPPRQTVVPPIAPSRTGSAPAQALARPTAPAVKAAVLPQRDEDSSVWPDRTPQTDNLTAKVDTDPATARSASGAVSRKRRAFLKAEAEAAARRRLFWIIGIASGAFLLILGLILLLAFWPSSAKDTTTDSKSESTNKGKPPLVVNPVGGEGVYRTLAEAVDKAGYGDRIVLQSSIAETVRIDGKKNLTIEGEPGKLILWKAPRYPADVKMKLLLDLYNVENLTLRNLTLDGAGVADTLINMFGRCPGIRIENVRFEGFKQYGIQALNCQGTSDYRITLKGLHFTTDTKPDTKQVALYFASGNVKGDQPSRFFTIEECTLIGKGTAVKASKPADVEKATFQGQPDFMP
jgi:hypothetical protein